MKKIAILTSGILPVPAVQGGAVENLVDYYLAYNEQHRLYDITVYSVWHPDVEKHPARQSAVNHYCYIKTETLWAKIKKKTHQLTHGQEYYHYTIEYFLEQAMKHIGRQHYDLIILENRPGFALSVRKKTSARLVYHLHNDHLNSTTPQANALYEAATGIITVSDYISSRVRSICPNDRKCHTVHNGIDLQLFQKAAECNDASGMTLVYTGRIIREKGIGELIDAMLSLKDYPEISLMVIGGSFYANSNDADDFIEELRQKAEPIRNRIRFTGFVPYVKVPGLLAMANVAVLPSTWDEPFGLTVTEALAAGLPIITTRKGGIPEIVTDQNAILLNADEHLPESLANAILYLYQHKEKRDSLAAASSQQAARFSKEVYAQNFFQCIMNYEL